MQTVIHSPICRSILDEFSRMQKLRTLAVDTNRPDYLDIADLSLANQQLKNQAGKDV